MVFTVSVRDTRILDESLRARRPVTLPDECTHNSHVVRHLLSFAPRVLPAFGNLDEEDVKRVADSVAYLMRPDLIIHGMIGMGPRPVVTKTLPVIHGEDGVHVHLRNDPKVLSPDWKLGKKNEYLWNTGAELFRCYSGTLSEMPYALKELGVGTDYMKPAFGLADLTAFLLDPRDLTDYDYTPEEIGRFTRTLVKEMREV
ncbi:MAG: hypothetical protein HYS81_02640 [Candidatus Aenigmatarchaeota archaeon]|nr:MAG: hypothetical protein HYS81_02640 [Candidatus Aenigmarchaeota archaeon]